MSEISVIIPTYQHAETIQACIESLLAQTVKPKEIIVIDDGSTDGTRHIVEGFADSILYRFQTNQGAPVARNAGATLASGRFLLFCDADVAAKPQMLEQFLRALSAHPEVAYAYSGFYFGSRLFKAKQFSEKSLRSGNYIHTAALIRREAFAGFDPSLKRLQDWDLWLTMLERGYIGVAVDEPLFSVTEVKGREGISHWLPSIAYRLPWHFIGWKPKSLRLYEAAHQIVARKHHLL